MKKRISLDLHIAMFIFDIIFCIQFTINNYIHTTNYVIHSIVVNCLATNSYHNLCKNLAHPIDYGC